jgi:hypothetical protein
MGYPQPSRSWVKAKFDDEIPGGSCDVPNDDDVRTQSPYGSHPCDNLRKWIVRADKERFHPGARKRFEVRPAFQDGVCDIQI